MRRMIVALALFALPVSAQRLSQLGVQLDQMERQMKDRAAAIRRDAFLVSQLSAATGELDDFQRNAALAKAHDRVVAAQRRARDNPPAAPQVQTAISQTLDLVEHAQQQAATADMTTLKRDV